MTPEMEASKMVVILVARKPVEGTVANNALKYGTGGINIDGCRIRYETTANAASNPLYRKSNGYKTTVGADTNPSSYKLKSEISEMRPNQAGRWPANLIFEHKAGCRCTGTKDDKSDSPTPDRIGMGRDGNWTKGIYGAKGSKITSAYASPEGKETISAWDCLPGCPVAELDRQSGKSCSTGGFVKGSTGAFGKNGIYHTAEGQKTPPGFGDIGGASRFFKQIQMEEET